MSIDFHRRMLADRVRHTAFRDALSRLIVPGKTTVADIGAGTGVLAFFARELGAREVWLYEPGMVIELAEALAGDNGIDGLHFVQEHSLDVQEPTQVDLVVAEVLGNFAYEEGVLDTLRDARRFLNPGGAIVPHGVVQFVAPVIAAGFDDELASWQHVGHGLKFAIAEGVARNNMYVYAIEPGQLMSDGAREWDRVTFLEDFDSRREGTIDWRIDCPVRIYGFALWWTATLTPGVELTTSPYAPRTHWDQIYLPLETSIDARAGDDVTLTIATETTPGIPGIAVAWTVTHRGRGEVVKQSLDIGRGFLG
jgi:protein arginine N-methyltransferase 1